MHDQLSTKFRQNSLGGIDFSGDLGNFWSIFKAIFRGDILRRYLSLTTKKERLCQRFTQCPIIIYLAAATDVATAATTAALFPPPPWLPSLPQCCRMLLIVACPCLCWPPSPSLQPPLPLFPLPPCTTYTSAFAYHLPLIHPRPAPSASPLIALPRPLSSLCDPYSLQLFFAPSCHFTCSRAASTSHRGYPIWLLHCCCHHCWCVTFLEVRRISPELHILWSKNS